MRSTLLGTPLTRSTRQRNGVNWTNKPSWSTMTIMRLSTQADYAVRAVYELSLREPGAVVQTHDIAAVGLQGRTDVGECLLDFFLHLIHLPAWLGATVSPASAPDRQVASASKSMRSSSVVKTSSIRCQKLWVPHGPGSQGCV